MSPRRARRRTAWELVACGFRGHVLPAADAEAIERAVPRRAVEA